MFASKAARCQKNPARAASRRMVDIHSHFLPKTWPDYAKKFGGDEWPWLRHHGEKPGGTYGYDRRCGAMLMVGDADFRPVTAACWDVSERLRDLDRMGIDRQIISQTPLLFQWHRDSEITAAISRDFNDMALEMVRESAAQGRLTSLCQVPLNDIDKACAEISRAKAMGHVGVQIGNHLGSRDLDDDELVAFLQHCAYEDFPVLVHPWEMSSMGPGNRSSEFMMGWTVGMPMETHLSITRMILGGAFDRLPESLKICFAHGGGAFPALLGRMDNAWRERSIARGKAQRPPREYVGRFHLDSACFDPAVLRLLLDVFGADRVMLGSDYPFPLGEQQIGSLAQTVGNKSDREAILWKNAEEFFGLSPAMSVQEEEVKERLVVETCFQDSERLPPSLVAPAGGQEPAKSPQKQGHPMLLQVRGFSSIRSALEQRSSPMAGPGAMTVRQVPNIIGGKRLWPGESLQLVDPSTGEADGEVACSSAEDVHAAVRAARAALESGSEWQQMTLEQRCAALMRLASLVEGSASSFVHAESRDTGKPWSLAETLDIPRSIANLRFFASLALHSGNEAHRSQGPMESFSYSLRKPVGVVGIVTPWNLPLYLLTWKLAPALAMGNTVVVKPSELTPTTATMLAEHCAAAGIPPGVVNLVHGEGHVTGQALVAHPEVAAVSFTGGTVTGAKVAATAAAHFKKLSLELGGKNAAIVFDDCSFEETVAGVVRSAFLNSGQICLCSSRVLVQRGADGTFYQRFLDALVAAVRQLTLGAPDDPSTDLGPVVSRAHLAKISAAVEAARAEGGRVLTGGRTLERPGFYFEPTVIEGLDTFSSLAQNEVFGPVISVHPFDDEQEAVELANSTRYGLSASLWSESLSRVELAEQLRAGTVWVNTWLNRELHMPFGGVRDSGVNREGGVLSLDFYSEATTVCMKRGSRAPLPMPGGQLGHRPAAAAARGRGFSTAVPRPLGSYAFSRQAGDLVFLAGIGPRDPETDQVPGGPMTDPMTGLARDYDIALQTRQCFANVREVLRGAGCSLADVVDVQVFLVDMKRDFAGFNQVWAEEMDGLRVTRTTVAISDLPPGGRIAVEFKVVAQRPRAD
eukprot:TRINITY_DN36809_c0_g1_i2.p1 TRINITY_DN36809_c0_g1~~TRINITY_DN36809_c0_g1_i2.p1  ORF type:complete len:1089 (+),score=177.23 TRINITY_DN36809_c0_g1_i2:76-3342(+)